MRPSLGVRQKIFGSTKKKRATLTGDSANPKKAKTETEEGESEAAMANEQNPSEADGSNVIKEEEDDDDEDLFGDADEDDTEEKRVAATTSSKAAAPGSAEVASAESAVPTKKEQTSTASTSGAAVAEVKKEAETPAPAPAPASATPVASGVPGFTSTSAAVPRKPSTPKSSSSPSVSAADNSNSNPGAKYGLPPGVKIPVSVQRKNLLHGKALDALKKIPVELMNESLTEYDDAVQIKGESIRNHAAYLYGVIKRYVDVQEARGGTMMQTSLTFAVHKRLEQLVRSGYCTQLEMDEKVCPYVCLCFFSVFFLPRHGSTSILDHTHARHLFK